MKKWWWLIICTVLLVACSDKVESPNTIDEETAFFTGEITSIAGSEAIVNAPIGGGRMDIGVNLQKHANETFAVGDMITVEYKGGIRESHPAQVTVVSIVKAAD